MEIFHLLKNKQYYMEQEAKSHGKSIVVKPETHAELNSMRLEYAYVSEEAKSFDEIIQFLITFHNHAIEKIENEKSMG